MDALFDKHQLLLQQLNQKFDRIVENEISWDDRLIGIKGSRGVGKTTLLLQHIKRNYGFDTSALYVDLDDFTFNGITLQQLAKDFHKKGGKVLLLDEVHKYEHWSKALKNIYDSLPELKVVFTGSSVMHILHGSADLSRRAVMYRLHGLSFREYLQIETGKKLDVVSLSDIISNHPEICRDIVKKLKPLKYFDDYLKHGYFPYYLQNKKTYSMKVAATISLMMEVDIPLLTKLDFKYVHKLKKLLYILATSVPYQPNINKLAMLMETSRTTVLNYLHHLKDAELVHLLLADEAGHGILSKPEKIYLHNTNLMYAIAPQNVNKGNLRETFFYNQLALNNKVESTEKGDFKINGKLIFEVGGEDKTSKQIKGIKNSFID
jgi:predicted AAA+ superfamily ATPase